MIDWSVILTVAINVGALAAMWGSMRTRLDALEREFQWLRSVVIGHTHTHSRRDDTYD